MTHIWVGFTHRQHRLYLHSVQRITYSNSTCPCLFSEKRGHQEEYTGTETKYWTFFKCNILHSKKQTSRSVQSLSVLHDLKKKTPCLHKVESKTLTARGFWLKIKVKIKLRLIILSLHTVSIIPYHTISCFAATFRTWQKCSFTCHWSRQKIDYVHPMVWVDHACPVDTAAPRFGNLLCYICYMTVGYSRK